MSINDHNAEWDDALYDVICHEEAEEEEEERTNISIQSIFSTKLICLTDFTCAYKKLTAECSWNYIPQSGHWI